MVFDFIVGYLVDNFGRRPLIIRSTALIATVGTFLLMIYPENASYIVVLSMIFMGYAYGG